MGTDTGAARPDARSTAALVERVRAAHRRVGRLLAAVICGLLVITPGPTAARETLSAIATLSPAEQQVSDRNLAVDDRGRFGVAWDTIFSGKPGVTFRLRRLSGSWSSPVVFSKGSKTFSSRLAATSDGRWVLAWRRVRADGSEVIQVAVRGRDGTWAQQAVGKVAASKDVFFLDLRSDARGHAVVYYGSITYSSSGDSEIVARTLDKEGGWSPADRLALPNFSAHDASVALSANGHSTIAVGGLSPETEMLYLAGRGLDGTWSAASEIAPPGLEPWSGRLVQTGPGSALVLYTIQHDDGTTVSTELWAADVAPDGTFAEPGPVPATFRTSVFGAHANPDGGMVLTWADRGGVHWLPRSADGRWGDVRSWTARGFVFTDAAALADGRWVAVWNNGGRVLRRYLRPNGSWSDIRAVSGDKSGAPQVQAGPSGGFAVMWLRDFRLQIRTVQ